MEFHLLLYFEVNIIISLFFGAKSFPVISRFWKDLVIIVEPLPRHEGETTKKVIFGMRVSLKLSAIFYVGCFSIYYLSYLNFIVYW